MGPSFRRDDSGICCGDIGTTERTPDMSNTHGPLRIGIGGPVGSGKTALVEALCTRFKPSYQAELRSGYVATKTVEQADRIVALAAHPAVTVPTGADIREFEGRVALDATCFDAPSFPSGCSRR